MAKNFLPCGHIREFFAEGRSTTRRISRPFAQQLPEVWGLLDYLEPDVVCRRACADCGLQPDAAAVRAWLQPRTSTRRRRSHAVPGPVLSRRVMPAANAGRPRSARCRPGDFPAPSCAAYLCMTDSASRAAA